MAQIPIAVDSDKAALKDQFIAARDRLAAIEVEMSDSPNPTRAYAALGDVADILGKTLKVVYNKLLT